MLEREESKVPLILLLVLSILALALTVSGLIISVVWGYIDFTMNSLTSDSIMCSYYLTLKLQYNLGLIYTVIFIGGCVSLLSQLMTILSLVYLTVKFCKYNDKYY